MAGHGTVLLVGNFFGSSQGASHVGEELSARLSRSGWNLLLTSRKEEPLPRLVDMMATAWLRRDQYGVAQVDVFSGPAFVWAEAVCWALRRAGKPYVLTLRGGHLPQFANRWPGRARRLLRSAAAVTVPSRYLLETMHRFRSDLRLLPNPLDLSAYPFRLRVQPQPHLIWLRAFHQVYRPWLAPEVLAMLVHNGFDAYLTMVGRDKGDGSLERTRRAAEAFGVVDRVAFPGGVAKSEVSNWLDAGDIFLNTTSVDNTPVSVLEAMACGMCVVSTDAGGLPYLLRDGHDALLAPTEDTAAMAAAAYRVLTEPGLAPELSEHAHRTAEGCDWSVVLPQWERLFATVAQCSRP